MLTEPKFLTITRWYCDDCQRSGQVAHDAHDDVWTVYTYLMDAHHKTSPTCEGGRWEIRTSEDLTKREQAVPRASDCE